VFFLARVFVERRVIAQRIKLGISSSRWRAYETWPDLQIPSTTIDAEKSVTAPGEEVVASLRRSAAASRWPVRRRERR
jgi:hypothetical protein